MILNGLWTYSFQDHQQTKGLQFQWSLVLIWLVPSAAPTSPIFSLPGLPPTHWPDLGCLRTQESFSFSICTLLRRMTGPTPWFWAPVIDWRNSAPQPPSLLWDQATCQLLNIRRFSKQCSGVSLSSRLPHLLIPHSHLSQVLREEICVGRERNPLRNPGKSGVWLGLELCYGEGERWACTSLPWQRMGWGEEKPWRQMPTRSVCETGKVEREWTSHQRLFEAKDKACSGNRKEHALCCLPLDRRGRNETRFMREFLGTLSYS